MIERLVALDVALFQVLNGRLHTPVLDAVMRAVTTQDNWYVVLLGIWVALIIWGGRRGRLAAVMLVVAVALADQASCSLMKPTFARLRPPNALDAECVRLIVGGSKAFSFPSAHAANSFAMATVATWLNRRLAPLFLGVAALVAYSRVYVGLHYPLDIVAGALLGAGLGWVSIRLVLGVERWWKRRRAAALGR